VNVGDAPAARRCYEAHASAVRTELGIEPDPSIGVAAAGIAVSAPLTPAKLTTIESQAASPVATSRRGRMALLVALVLLLAVSFRNAATPVQDDDTSVMTVLVAPFAHDALGRALADASARRLVTLPDVRVLDPAAIQSNEQVLRAAQRLGVRWVVTGTWSKGADSLVAEASITDVRSGRIVVGIAPASAAAGDSSALIDAVSQRIAAAVAMTRGAPDDVRMATFTLPTRTDALEWFRMGLESAGRGDPILAARHLQRATAADPAFVPAAINLAAELLNAGDIIGARRVAARLGQSAHRLSPVERHLLDWLNNYLDGDLDAAARAAFAAHVSAPDSPELRVVAGQAALWTGKVDVAVQLLGSIDTLGTSPASDVGY
jgi:TolB-like protein